MTIFKNINNQQVWNSFAKYRKTSGYTQEKIANETGFTQSWISQYESGNGGENKPPVERKIEQTLLMCQSIGFPFDQFIPSIPTKVSRVAECKVLYLATASDGLQNVTCYGITKKDADERLKELDKTKLWQHEFVAEYKFTNVCLAATLERSIKQKFGYNPRVGEYLSVDVDEIRNHVHGVVELGGWDYTLILALS